MKRIGLLTLALLLLLSVDLRAADTKTVIATGGIGGVYYYYGTQVAEILTKNNISSATAIQTAAAVDNMLLIRDKSDAGKGTYFFATVLPDTAYFAVNGKHEKFAAKPARAKVLWMMYPNLLHVVTTGKNGIKSLADLQDKRISTGAPGSGTEFSVLNLLQAAAIDPARFKKWEKLGAKESDEGLTNGTLDAYFWAGGLPTGSIVELSNTLKRQGSELVLLPLSPEEPGVAAFLKEFNGLTQSMPIPKEVYGTAADTPSLAFWNMFVCPEDTPEELAYQTTRAVFENIDTLHGSVKAAKDTTLANTAKFVGSSAIPFHPGAVRYFKEKGLVQ